MYLATDCETGGMRISELKDRFEVVIQNAAWRWRNMGKLRKMEWSH